MSAPDTDRPQRSERPVVAGLDPHTMIAKEARVAEPVTTSRRVGTTEQVAQRSSGRWRPRQAERTSDSQRRTHAESRQAAVHAQEIVSGRPAYISRRKTLRRWTQYWRSAVNGQAHGEAVQQRRPWHYADECVSETHGNASTMARPLMRHPPPTRSCGKRKVPQ